MEKEEVEAIITHMANGKTAGPDGIPNEILKYGGPAINDMIYTLLSKCWRDGQIPE